MSHRGAINPEHCDTIFPAEPTNSQGEKSYFTLRFELSQLSSKYEDPTYPSALALTE